MTEKEFFKRVANGKDDFLQSFVDILKKKRIRFCVIGGLAVNAYAEPVVSLDLDVVIVSEKIDELLGGLPKRFKMEKFEHSINIRDAKSDLRIQIQTDERYQKFLKGVTFRNVLGYHLPVARIEDVFQGKVWAAMDKTRRQSKQQKDLADILRLIEVKGALVKLLPGQLSAQLRLN